MSSQYVTTAHARYLATRLISPLVLFSFLACRLKLDGDWAVLLTPHNATHPTNNHIKHVLNNRGINYVPFTSIFANQETICSITLLLFQSLFSISTDEQFYVNVSVPVIRLVFVSWPSTHGSNSIEYHFGAKTTWCHALCRPFHWLQSYWKIYNKKRDSVSSHNISKFCGTVLPQLL